MTQTEQQLQPEPTIYSFRSSDPELPASNKKCTKKGFEYVVSEFEVCFGLAPRNGELLECDPEKPELYSFSFRVRVKTWGVGHIYSATKGPWFN